MVAQKSTGDAEALEQCVKASAEEEDLQKI